MRALNALAAAGLPRVLDVDPGLAREGHCTVAGVSLQGGLGVSFVMLCVCVFCRGPS